MKTTLKTLSKKFTAYNKVIKQQANQKINKKFERFILKGAQ